MNKFIILKYMKFVKVIGVPTIVPTKKELHSNSFFL